LRERHECIPLPEPVDPGFYQSPAQETGCGEDEDNDDRFILERIALEASSEHVFFPGVFAYGQIVVEAECARAVGACELVMFVRLGSWWVVVGIVAVVFFGSGSG